MEPKQTTCSAVLRAGCKSHQRWSIHAHTHNNNNKTTCEMTQMSQSSVAAVSACLCCCFRGRARWHWFSAASSVLPRGTPTHRIPNSRESRNHQAKWRKTSVLTLIQAAWLQKTTGNSIEYNSHPWTCISRILNEWNALLVEPPASTNVCCRDSNANARPQYPALHNASL